MYRITFSKIGKFLIYQVWDKDNIGNINAKRRVYRLPAKEWVNDFITYNKLLKQLGKELFTPTTIMETTSEDEYAFVIRKIHFDSHDRVVFTVSTKEIVLKNNTSKKLIQIPCGKFCNMRFDIDFISNNDYIYNAVPQGTTNNPDVRCWTDDQFAWNQSRVLQRKFFSSIYTPRGIPPGPGMRNSSNGDSQEWWAYPCSSY